MQPVRGQCCTARRKKGRNGGSTRRRTSRHVSLLFASSGADVSPAADWPNDSSARVPRVLRVSRAAGPRGVLARVGRCAESNFQSAKCCTPMAMLVRRASVGRAGFAPCSLFPFFSTARADSAWPRPELDSGRRRRARHRLCTVRDRRREDRLGRRLRQPRAATKGGGACSLAPPARSASRDLPPPLCAVRAAGRVACMRCAERAEAD